MNAQFVSVTGVLVVGALYYGWAIGRKGFGSFKQLYGLNLVQGVFSQTLVAIAIVLAIVIGQDNIYTTPEFYPPAQGIGVLGLPLPPDGKNFGHAIEHIVVAGAIAFPIIWSSCPGALKPRATLSNIPKSLGRFWPTGQVWSFELSRVQA